MVHWPFFMKNFKILETLLKQHEIKYKMQWSRQAIWNQKLNISFNITSNELTNVMTYYLTDQAINQAYPVVQDSPLSGHIEKTANIKRNTNVKCIVFQKNIVKGIIKLHQWYLFSSIDEWINVYWVPSLNTPHIIAFNQLSQSHISYFSRACRNILYSRGKCQN